MDRAFEARVWRLLAFCGLALAASEPLWAEVAAPPRLPERPPAELGLRPDKLAEIDAAVERALAEGKLPGCVVVVGRKEGIAWRKAYGRKRIEPDVEPMTVDTLFDLASLTKPLATGLAAMILVDEGKLELQRPAADFWPDFDGPGKNAILVKHLLLHTGGLIADNALSDYADGPAAAWRKLAGVRPSARPGEKFTYSDVSFLVLGKVVEQVSGETLDAFTRRKIYAPLGLRETGYLPAEDLRKRAAPTQQRQGRWMQGEVHDPRAFALGGVAGHAGLFSTADDLALLAAMLLGRGEYRGVRILNPQTWQAMTARHAVPGGADGRNAANGHRCLGWDSKSGFSSNRGISFSEAAFGHGGFTGTSFWVDPEKDLFVIFLSNRVHPNGKGSVNPLAGQIGTIAGEAVQP